MERIHVSSTIFTNHKVMNLAHISGDDRYTVVGRMLALWIWALENAPDGLMPLNSEDYITEITGYDGDKDHYLTLLQVAEWLREVAVDEEQSVTTYYIVGWDEDSGPLSRYSNPNK